MILLYLLCCDQNTTDQLYCITIPMTAFSSLDYTYLKSYLQELGFEPRQSDIFIVTYQYGPKPASTIASLCQTERSYCYKILEEFVSQWLVEQILIKGVRHYHISSTDVLLGKIEQQQDKINTLKDQYMQAQQQFNLLVRQQSRYIPKIQQFEGVEWIKQWYQDMIQSIETQWVLIIKCTITTIFDSQVTRFNDLQSMFDHFITTIDSKRINIVGYIGSGSLIVESMNPIQNTNHIKTISVWNQSIQLWVIGEITYIGLFRQLPIGIKLRSPDMSDLLQTMMEFMR